MYKTVKTTYRLILALSATGWAIRNRNACGHEWDLAMKVLTLSPLALCVSHGAVAANYTFNNDNIALSFDGANSDSCAEGP